jgi:hypothetical protein
MLKYIAAQAICSICIHVCVKVLAVPPGLQRHQYRSRNRSPREVIHSIAKDIAIALPSCIFIAVSRVFHLVASVKVLEKIVFIVLKSSL